MLVQVPSVLVELADLFERSSAMPYIGEPISQLEHALQAGELAERAGADRDLVLGALLHDVGHLCAPDDAPRMDDLGVLHHERIGAELLERLGLPERVCQLASGHVRAKRYLSTRSGYAERLSPASTGTLIHQGGPMTPDEIAAFERDPLSRDLVRLRGWDEQAKRTEHPTPPFAHFLPLLRAALGLAG